ncbi:MAG: peptide deformylase [Candidatus Taylorbacteria bacterium RIFCSPHIGHO2_02_FULL_47_18]|uniref:Peptide deformylase n=1 Tax=Candidatus Taylorbacteria bacterium RIFCSPLOWO2_01_FULL_48_100 TaxID=1802322 RepID=A0A1G2NFT3_9BACT|nr:MAG: peptide deformylase [Candidatus Taylorbacteria bacterium RIFCSPHIGHO2_01_FULL_48_38]OHA28451.1 MAG: peptide deformylase [Candidatus Taylorbacteria bacterium RIFCSPHIGHO2_02_FULL_47_18]OHA34945.1 MAG: peptide deformylase [Candidatus Taylorbacteria bacterium RIFCSPLOWO2_01_FULL_48_100]OHA40206.1 MAG: peptide deformylase [Candidatus Taylorbacteria bacterium RIFCSPLOWO2_02_FULL_48_16]OHA45460.1 MAG: peptide deformylase [Candidatus Taylorbacteria bacterium RIFCSPLOWO2_12_FULL_48_11]
MPTHTVHIVKDEKTLRFAAREVPLDEIKTEKMRAMLADMSSALAKEDDGVALAAPQIGESVRLFIVSGRVLARLARKSTDETASAHTPPDAVFFNPVLTKISREKQTVEEGCLSLRYLYGQVKRAAKVTLEAYDADGKKITRGAAGLLAQIFQHEVDHLNGILFIDKATDIIDIPPEELKK